jgi:hypothetical protein
MDLLEYQGKHVSKPVLAYIARSNWARACRPPG